MFIYIYMCVFIETYWTQFVIIIYQAKCQFIDELSIITIVFEKKRTNNYGGNSLISVSSNMIYHKKK